VTPPSGPTHRTPGSVSTEVKPSGGGSRAESDGVPAARDAPPGAPLSHAELVAVGARDPGALGRFFDCYFDRVYGLVYRLVGERGAAEDLTQEVFLKVHRAAHQLDPTRDPGPWLTAIAYNACRDFWRSSAYRMRARSGSIEADPALAARLTRGTNDPERDLLAEERRELVLRAIQRLPEPLRIAVVLYEYEGLSHEQIARMTGINHAAARKRYSRALESLGKMLREALG